MFFIERKEFRYQVETSAKGVDIKPATSSPLTTSNLTPLIIRNLKLIAEYLTKDLNYKDKEAALIDYFKCKGYSIIQYLPKLGVDKSGRMKVGF